MLRWRARAQRALPATRRMSCRTTRHTSPADVPCHRVGLRRVMRTVPCGTRPTKQQSEGERVSWSLDRDSGGVTERELRTLIEMRRCVL